MERSKLCNKNYFNTTFTVLFSSAVSFPFIFILPHKNKRINNFQGFQSFQNECERGAGRLGSPRAHAVHLNERTIECTSLAVLAITVWKSSHPAQPARLEMSECISDLLAERAVDDNFTSNFFKYQIVRWLLVFCLFAFWFFIFRNP